MCGIIGIAGNVGPDGKKAFTEMLYAGALRGGDSTGIAVVDTQGRTKVFKKAFSAIDFLNCKDYDKTLVWGDNIYIGHNRAATRGEVNHNNAHPFEAGKIVGVHNGTLRGEWRLPDSKYFAVDSETLINAIATLGIDEAWKLTEGAAALVWWNTEDKTLNMLRNTERPLFYAWTEDKKTLMWASEWHMMLWLASRNGIKLETPLELPPNVLHTFTVPLGFAAAAKEFEKVHVRQLSPFVPMSYPGYQGGNGGYHGRGGNVGNVSPFPKKTIELLPPPGRIGRGISTTTAADNLFDPHKDFYDDNWDIEIPFVGKYRDSSPEGNAYWVCETSLDPKINLRVCLNLVKGSSILLDKDSIELNELLGSGVGLTGLVKAIKFGNEFAPVAYLLIDRRTITIATELEETPPEDTDEESIATYVKGYNGRMLSLREFETVVHHGCGVCSGIPDVDAASTLIWTTPDSFICDECKDLPLVHDFMNIRNTH